MSTPPSLDYQTPLPPPENRLRRTALVVVLTVGGLVVSFGAMAVLMPSLNSRQQTTVGKCRSNEHQIGLCILLYQQDHSNHYPNSLAEILSAEQIGPSVLVCPDSKDSPATLPPPPAGQDGPTTRQEAAALAVPGHVSYVYCGHADWTDATVPANAVVLYEPIANHGSGSNILFGDGHAEFVSRPRAARLIAAATASTRPVSALTVP